MFDVCWQEGRHRWCWLWYTVYGMCRLSCRRVGRWARREESRHTKDDVVRNLIMLSTFSTADKWVSTFVRRKFLYLIPLWLETIASNSTDAPPKFTHQQSKQTKVGSISRCACACELVLKHCIELSASSGEQEALVEAPELIILIYFWHCRQVKWVLCAALWLLVKRPGSQNPLFPSPYLWLHSRSSLELVILLRLAIFSS